MSYLQGWYDGYFNSESGCADDSAAYLRGFSDGAAVKLAGTVVSQSCFDDTEIVAGDTVKVAKGAPIRCNGHSRVAADDFEVCVDYLIPLIPPEPYGHWKVPSPPFVVWFDDEGSYLKCQVDYVEKVNGN